MSRPHDKKDRYWRYSSTTPVSNESEVQNPSHTPQTYDSQTSTASYSYNSPQGPTLPYSGGSSYHQTSAQPSYAYHSRRDAPLSSSNSSQFSDATIAASQSRALIGHDQYSDTAYTQQPARKPYVQGAVCSTKHHGAHQDDQGGERQRPLRNKSPPPAPGRRDNKSGGPYVSYDHSNGDGARTYRDASMFEDDEDLPLDGHRNLRFPPKLPPTYQPMRRSSNTLEGVGGHLLEDRRSNQNDNRLTDAEPLIFGGSIEYSSNSAVQESYRASPDSLSSSMMSLKVNVGSPGSYVFPYLIRSHALLLCNIETDAVVSQVS